MAKINTFLCASTSEICDLSNLSSESLQSTTPVAATRKPCSVPDKTITISAAKYAALLREYRKLAVAFKRRADDIKRDSDALIADLDLQLNDLAKLN